MRKKLFLLFTLSTSAFLASCGLLNGFNESDEPAEAGELNDFFKTEDKETGDCTIEWYNVNDATPFLTTKGKRGEAVKFPDQAVNHPSLSSILSFAGWNNVKQKNDIGPAKSNKSLVIPNSATTYKLYAVYKYTKVDCLIKEDGSTVSLESLVNDGYLEISNKTLTATSGFNSSDSFGKYYIIVDQTEITTLGENAFKSNTNLKGIVFTSNLTQVSTNAFNECTSLSYISLPNSVSTLGNYSFKSCSSLESIQLPTSMTQINGHLFEECSKLESIEIPSGVTYIYEDSFKKCTSLKNVTIPNTVYKYYFNIFDSCTALETITIPKPEGRNFELSNSTNNMFNNCTNLKTIYYTGTMDEFQSVANWHHMGFNSTVKIQCSNGIIDPNS